MQDKPTVFVTTIAKELISKLEQDLRDQGFELSKPPYTHFSAKKKGISCTLYTSLKLTVQGKEMGTFIEFYLEPEILKSFTYSYPEALAAPVNLTARIGVDESGKGDFFGPLCAAAVFAEGAQIQELIKLGVKDSKLLSDKDALAIARKIQAGFANSVIKINPAKYNELYAKFQNLNRLLAWAHATAIENLSVISGCHTVIIDQFAHESVVQQALKRKKLEVDLEQKHKAESDVVVAAASILARAAFLDGLKKLSLDVAIELPKGASNQVITIGKKLVAKYGKEILRQVSKEHFKTTSQILNA